MAPAGTPCCGHAQTLGRHHLQDHFPLGGAHHRTRAIRPPPCEPFKPHVMGQRGCARPGGVSKAASADAGEVEVWAEETLMEAQLGAFLQSNTRVADLEAALKLELDAEEYAAASATLLLLKQARLESAAAREAAEGAMRRTLRWGAYAHGVGAVVTHRRYGYRGVVAGMDPTCLASPAWMAAMRVDALSQGRFQPFYHVLVDERDRPGGVTTYVAEENLVAPRGVRPILHPLMDELFLGMSKEGVYNPSMKLHLLFRKRLGPQ
ncbi:hypothetical protein ACKKBF_B01400 [Auxenochlorella protothecoides x Auxenochlorella symbiontica]|uniref:Hemimethylated DNA-binding domain-containing protein n=2 Tax=Auxenochlorella protothecoides TaxID=3075 RepID=A0A1D1ZXT8_AUXPR